MDELEPLDLPILVKQKLITNIVQTNCKSNLTIKEKCPVFTHSDFTKQVILKHEKNYDWIGNLVTQRHFSVETNQGYGNRNILRYSFCNDSKRYKKSYMCRLAHASGWVYPKDEWKTIFRDDL